MDLSLFNSHREHAEKEKQTTFDNPITAGTHFDSDLHLIGESLPAPTLVTGTTIGGSTSIGISPNPAREDHDHGGHSHSFVEHSHDEDDLPNPLGPIRIALEDGSAGSPSLYWPDSGGTQNLGIYRVDSNNSIQIRRNGFSIVNLSTSKADFGVDIESNGGDIRAIAGVSGGGFYGDRLVTGVSSSGVAVESDHLDMNEFPIRNAAAIFSDNWFRSEGDTGWFSEDHQGGIRMTDEYWVRAYGAADGFITNGRAAGGLETTSTYTGYQDILWNTTITTWHRYTSTINSKREVRTLDIDSGTLIDLLRPVSFIAAPKENEGEEEKRFREKDVQWGFIAEEVCEIDEKNNTRLGTYEVKGEDLIPSSWHPRPMVALLVKEVQSLRRRLDIIENN